MRRTEIMRAAEEAFLARGYGEATTDEIAARAGASKATIYKQFGNKEGLLAEIVRNSVPDIAEASSQALQAEGTLSAVLVEWSLAVLELVTASRAIALYKLILAEQPKSPELAEIFYNKGPLTCQQQLTVYFRQAVSDGRMRCEDPALASRLFIAAVIGDGFERALLGLSGYDGRRRKTRIYVDEAVAMFLARYGA